MKRELGQWMTLVLGALCGVFALTAILQSLGVGSGYHLLADQPAELEPELTQPMQQIEFKLPDLAQYIEIYQRPLFTNDRKPRPIDDKAGALASTEAPPVPLNASLLGVLIDPERQVAILRDNASSTVIRVRQGMPWPRDLSGWTLKELGGRAKRSLRGARSRARPSSSSTCRRHRWLAPPRHRRRARRRRAWRSRRGRRRNRGNRVPLAWSSPKLTCAGG